MTNGLTRPHPIPSGCVCVLLLARVRAGPRGGVPKLLGRDGGQAEPALQEPGRQAEAPRRPLPIPKEENGKGR